MNKVIFVLIVLVWTFIGYLAMVYASKKDDSKINYVGIIYIIIFLAIPFFAKLCDLI